MQRLVLPVVYRATTALLSIFLLISIVYTALDLLGAPLTLYISEGTSKEDIDQIRQNLGYDQPFTLRFLQFWGGLLTGRFPDSYQYGRNALNVALEHIGPTLLLGLVSLILASSIGLIVGYLRAFSGQAWVRRSVDTFNALFSSVPVFVLGFALIYFFGVRLKLLPLGGEVSLRALILPAVTLAFIEYVPIARLFTTSLTQVQAQPFVATFRSTGARERSIRLHSVVPNSLSPTVGFIGTQLGGVLSGSIVVENVFRWPGIGLLLTQAVGNQDYPLIIAIVFVTMLAFIVSDVAISTLHRRLLIG